MMSSRRRSRRVLSFWCAAVVAVVSVGVYRVAAETPRAIVAATAEGRAEAFTPGASRRVVDGAVHEVVPHPTGRYALVTRYGDGGEASLMVYDAAAGRARVLWSSAGEKGRRCAQVRAVHWIPGTNAAVALVEVHAERPVVGAEDSHGALVLAADVSRGVRARTVLTYPADDHDARFTLAVSHARPLAYAATYRPPADPEKGGGEWRVRFLEADGRLGAPLLVREVPEGHTKLDGWTADGGAAVFHDVTPLPPGTPPEKDWKGEIMPPLRVAARSIAPDGRTDDSPALPPSLPGFVCGSPPTAPSSPLPVGIGIGPPAPGANRIGGMSQATAAPERGGRLWLAPTEPREPAAFVSVTLAPEASHA